jgi:hypothetical protein
VKGNNRYDIHVREEAHRLKGFHGKRPEPALEQGMMNPPGLAVIKMRW